MKYIIIAWIILGLGLCGYARQVRGPAPLISYVAIVICAPFIVLGKALTTEF